MIEPKLWTKDFLILAFVNFFVALNFYLLMVVMSVFAMENFSSPPSEAGLSSSIFVLGALFARLFSGNWIERIGRKKLLYAGLTLSLLMSSLYFGISGVTSLLIIRVLHGAGFGITSTALGTIVTNIIPKERRGEGIGYYMLSVTLATAIGPFLALFISQYGSFKLIFIVCIVSASLSLGATLFLTVPEMKLTEEYLKEISTYRLNNFFEAKAVPISLVCALLYFCYSSILAFLSAYSKEIDLVSAASFFFIVFATVILLSRPITGRLFDSKGENITMYPAIFIYMLGMIILSQAHHGYTLLLAGAFIGLGFGVVQSSGQAISVKVTPPHRLSLANSTFFIFLDLGSGIGPFLLGLLIPLTGFRGMYIVIAIVTFVCMFLYYLLHGKNVGQGKIGSSLAK